MEQCEVENVLTGLLKDIYLLAKASQRGKTREIIELIGQIIKVIDRLKTKGNVRT